MPRSHLLLLLADLLTRRLITTAEAASVLSAFALSAAEGFEANTIADLPTMAAPSATNEDWLIALAVVLLLSRGNTGLRLSLARRKMARNTLRRGFELNATALASSLTTPNAVPAWQEAFANTISQYTRQMTVAGAGTLPSGTVRSAVDAQLTRQWPFLQRFSFQMVVGQMLGRAMSEASVAGRSKLYGGPGWAGFWLGAEEAAIRPEGASRQARRPLSVSEPAELAEPKPGMIIHYEARDDAGNCGPCHGAAINGPYIAGESHPVPGSVCLGGGRCRCSLRFEYNPAEYARLTGRKDAA